MSSNISNIEDQAALTWLESLTDRGRRLVLVRGLDGRTSYVSDCAPDLTGWENDELAQRLYSLLHPEDQPVLFELSRAMQNGAEAERLLTTRLQHPAGHFQEFTGTVLDRRDDPAVRGLVVIMSPSRPRVVDDSPWPALLATSSEILVIHDRELAIQYVSPNVEKLLGVTPDQLVRDVRSMIHPDDVERFFETRAQVAAERGGEARMRLRVRDAADILHHLDLTIANHLDEHPVDGIIVRARDISDLIETEHLLDRSEARFAAMVASGPGASLLVAGDGEVLYCSDGIDELLGYQPDEVVGRFALEFVHPDDRAHAAEELVLLISGEEDTPTPTFRLRAKDGAYVSVDASATNRLDDPRLGALVLTLRDVTDRVTAERRMRRLLQDSSGSAYVINENKEVTWTTPGVERFLGGNRRLTPDTTESLVAEEDVESTAAAYHEVVRGGPGTSKRILCRMAPGHSKRWVDVVLTNAFDDPAINGIIVNIRDVDDAVRANETGHRLTEVLESTTDLVCVYDRDFTLIWANAAATAVLGPAPIPGNELERRLTEESMAIGGSEMIPTLRTTGMWRGELCLKRITDGEEIPVEVTALAHRGAHGVEFVSTISRDISERKAMEAQLNAKARHDVLTGLPNRFMLSERLEEMLARHETVGLLFLDLDQFKAVNDTQGHDAGDRLLVAAADRLQGALRPTDLVARFGGDEFIVLLPGVDREDAALRLGERVLAELRGPVQIGSIEVYLTASAGVALSDGADATTLISNADAAMYKAKAGGRDRIAMFSSELRSRTVQRLETAHQLRAAVDAGELDVWFQPIIDTVTGIPIALESLARWENGAQGFVSPAHFIEVAEQTGLIGALGTSIVRQTCAAIRALDTAAAPYSFSINLSVHQLADSALPDILRDALETYGIEPRQIHCEITESAVMDDVENSARVLDRIRALGIGIAIDDFGTGYSSLAYLHRLPVDVLKIDREFVSGLSYDMEWQRSLAAGIISLAHSLGLQVVAEGVETAEQAGILRQLHCDAMQGYLFARPTPLDGLPAVLEKVIASAPERTW